MKLSQSLRNLLKTHGEIPVRNYNAPLFITGCMRSGTTFLVSKLAEHPQLLKIGSELNYVWGEIGGAPCLDRCPSLTKLDANPKYTYNMSMYFRDFIEESKSIKRHLMRVNTYLSDGIERVFYDWKNIIPMNKSPHLTNKIPYIHALFPESKIIFIIRDIHAQSASMKSFADKLFISKKKVYFAPNDEKSCWSFLPIDEIPNSENYYPKKFSVLPEMWIKLNYIALKELSKIPTEKRIIIQYEDLVNEQSHILKKVFDHLNMEPKHKQATKSIIENKIKYINTHLKGNATDRWKKTLKKEEINMVGTAISENSVQYQEISSMVERMKIQ